MKTSPRFHLRAPAQGGSPFISGATTLAQQLYGPTFVSCEIFGSELWALRSILLLVNAGELSKHDIGNVTLCAKMSKNSGIPGFVIMVVKCLRSQRHYYRTTFTQCVCAPAAGDTILFRGRYIGNGHVHGRHWTSSTHAI